MAKELSYSVSKLPAAEQTQQAVGGYEAAAIMGVHFTRPYVLAKAGKLVSHSPAGDSGRRGSFFDGAECEANYRDYAEQVAIKGGTGKRARTNLQYRQQVLAHLKRCQYRIPLADAISAAEAAEIMGTHVTWVNRLANEQKLVARQLWSPRASQQPQWMVSRKSALVNLAAAKATYATGKMEGRVRDGLSKKR